MSNKSFILYFLFIICLSLVFRYPEGLHQTGIDTFDNHSEVESLKKNGFDERFINFLSFFGLFPYSHNMGAMFAMGSFSLISGTTTETSILFFSLSVGVMYSFSMFIFSHFLFRYNRPLILISVLLFSTTRFSDGVNSWTFVYKGILLFFLPVFYYALCKVRENNKFSTKFLFLVLIFLIIQFSIHRMSYFSLIGIIIWGLAILSFDSFKNYNLIITSNLKMKISVFSSLIMLILYLLPLYGFTFYGNGQTASDSDSLIFGSSQSFLIISLLINYSMSFGIMLILVPLGIHWLFSNISKNFFSYYLFLSVVLFSTFWNDTTYAKIYLLFFLAIIVTLGFNQLFSRIKKNNVAVLMVIFLFVPFFQLIPEFVEVRDSGTFQEEYPKPVYVEPEVYDASVYIKVYDSYDNIFSNWIHLENMIGAYSGYTPVQIPPYVNINDLKINNMSYLNSGDANYIFSEPSALYRIQNDVMINSNGFDDQRSHNALKYKFGSDESIFTLITTTFNTTEYHYVPLGGFIESKFLQDSSEQTYAIYQDRINIVRHVYIE